MHKKYRRVLAFLLIFINTWMFSQSFLRSELTTSLTTPWEITYGPDDFLWVTENGGKVARIDPGTGAKTIVYTAPDYFAGSPSEQLSTCFQPMIGNGTLGLTLHPDFINPLTSNVFFVYSYNSGTTIAPSTKFKIVKLTWDAASSTVTAVSDLVTNLPAGYDHLGGRLLAVKQNNINYLYYTIGDNGISEDNSPTCYVPQTLNPNNLTYDINYKNGKIHRFNIDGTIPSSNPIAGNSIFTRGHRNPQGLVFNSSQNVLYSIEHGDRTDDEINILESGKNYGWKNVRGYHSDNNFGGESAFVASYTTNPLVMNDGLKEAFYSWCATPQPTSGTYSDWCTVAPSDGIYYSSNAVPGWNNSILVTTLKNGANTDQEVYVFKLQSNGLSLAPSTTVEPNPSKFFSIDQALNGRLRDIAISPDGTKIYLINNGGADRDKITVYTYDPTGIAQETDLQKIVVFPNPFTNEININNTNFISTIQIENVFGVKVKCIERDFEHINTEGLAKGVYVLRIYAQNNLFITKKVLKQ